MRRLFAGRHKLRATSLSKLAYDLAPLRERHGDLPVQRLTKAHIDALVTDLVAGGTTTAKGRKRRPWSAIGGQQGDRDDRSGVRRRPAARFGVAQRRREHRPCRDSRTMTLDTYTEAEVPHISFAEARRRPPSATRGSWRCQGQRRGEIAGLRWADVDLDGKTLSIVEQPGVGGGGSVENDPKSATSRRTLPLPDRLVHGAEGGRGAAGRRAAGPGLLLPLRRLRGVQRDRRPLFARRCCPDIGGMR